jgi:hypothetical protein
MIQVLRRSFRRLFPKDRLRAPVVVYQMGKVGSSSLYESLKKLGLSVPLYHSHLLNDLDAIERIVRATLPNPGASLKEIERGRQLRQKILHSSGPRWSLISMVRDPVARNVSAFFQSISERVPDFSQRLQQGAFEMDALAEAFLADEVTHAAPLGWFDSQVKDLFGIDVCASPFPTRTGYAIYQGKRVRLLVMRLENLAECVGLAIRQFLGIRHFRLETHNVGEDKNYAEVYRRFKREVALPCAYLDRMYNSTFARRFYTAEEIDGFRRSWSQREPDQSRIQETVP